MTRRPYVAGSSASKPKTTTSEVARASIIASRVCVEMNGVSPYKTIALPSNEPRISLACATACAVPNCSFWSTTWVIGFQSSAPASTTSAPCPATTTMRDGSSSSPAFIACTNMGAPPISCITLGKSDCMRVPFPAPRIISATAMFLFYSSQRLWLVLSVQGWGARGRPVT